MSSSSATNLPMFIFTTFMDHRFQLVFLIGCILFYGLQQSGYIFYQYFNNKNAKNAKKQIMKIQMNIIEFGGYFMSTLHSVMMSTMATVITIAYNLQSSIDSTSHAFVQLYKLLSVLSVSFFCLDSFYLVFYYKHKSWTYRLCFLTHHTLLIICQTCVFSTNGYVSYIAAWNMLIEWSTVFLNVRKLAKIFECSKVFYVSGIGVLITYPLTRLVGLLYIMYLALQSKLDVYVYPGANMFLFFSNMFVYIMSAMFFFIVMLKKPSDMYILKKISNVKEM